MNVVESGTAVRRLAPSPAPDSPPTTLSQQGLVDKIVAADAEADVEWSVSGDTLGQHMHIRERMPLVLLLPLEYQILFVWKGTQGHIARHWEGSTIGSHVGPFTGRIPPEIDEPFQQALVLVKRNMPGDLEAAVAVLVEVCDAVQARPFHSAVNPVG
jgi:hypothetical protein